MCTHKERSRLLVAAGTFAWLLVALPAVAQQTDPSKIPWEKIEAWASAPEAPPVAKDQPKDAPKDVAKDHPKEPAAPADVPKDAPKDVTKDTPKDLAKDTPKDTAATWTPPRPGVRRPEPVAYQEIQMQLGRVLAERLKDTPNTQYRKLVEIYIMLEQFDRALGPLDKMAADPKRWLVEAKGGWISGKLWECALLCRVKPQAAWINQQFEDWKLKEPGRIDAYIAAQDLSASYRQGMMKTFQEKQEYYTKDGATIVEKMKELELKGDTEAAALLEIKDRCLSGRPDAPLTGLRALYKLRDWYPELPAVKSGSLTMSLVHHLASGFIMYREASKEAENLMEKSPTCAEALTGGPLYYAAEYAYQHAEHLAPNPSEGWMVQDRSRPVYKEAKEYWERARQYFLRLRKEFPTHSANTSASYSGVTYRLSYIARPERLGPMKP